MDRTPEDPTFEVDYGPTQEHKKARIKEVFGALPGHVRYVPVDFTKDDLLMELRKGGYAENAKTLLIWEGVTQYIPEASVKQTLHFVRDHAVPSSGLIFTYILSGESGINSPASRQARWGEPLLFGFPGDSAEPYLRQEGLTVASCVVGTELHRKYAQKSDASSPLPPLGRRNLRFCTARVPTRQ